jgi:dihydroorotase
LSVGWTEVIVDLSFEQLDLLVVASRLVCPATGLDGPGVVGVRDGLIEFVEMGDGGSEYQAARETLEVEDGILLPGLIDLHAHPAASGSKFGIDADRDLLPKGSTTVLSQGDAGARNVDQYISETIAGSRTTVKLALNFCAEGESNPAGRFFSLDEANIAECVAAVERGGSDIWGISLNIALIRGADVEPLEVMRRGMEAAERSGKPVMFGATKTADIPLCEQLALLRAGDVMTYCFYSGDGSIVQDGRVLDCVWEARERGVLFDVGDGAAAFGFDVAEIAVAEGFLPDTISTDYYLHHYSNRLDHDVPHIVSKMIEVGMTAEQCWPRVTFLPARVLGLSDTIGRLEAGAVADLCVVELRDDREPMVDGRGEVRMGRRWRPVVVVKGGVVVLR